MPILDKETSVFPENLLELPEPEPEATDRQWWAIFTKARQEKSLARDLLAREIPFYLPLVPKENRIRGRIVRSHIPLFSGYLFMYGCEDERYRSLTTNRISRILPVNDQLQLRTDLMHLHNLIETDEPLTIESRLEPGNRVRIKNGPMMGLEGIVTQRRGKRRLLVAVQFLQNGVSVEIDDFMVEPL
jgi:transcription antitermination factor NusG